MYAEKIVITVTCESLRRKNDHNLAFNGAQYSYTTTNPILATNQQIPSNQAIPFRRKHMLNRANCVEKIIEKGERNTYLDDEFEQKCEG